MFRTEPIVILTSGATVDGREIKSETVIDVANSYDPSVYNAMINVEHSPYSQKLGSVLSLSVQDYGDKKQLLAVLKPNDLLLYLIERGQKVHTSCEISMEFADTGKPYLVGLAVTDSPASLGTSEMHLSREGKQVEIFSSKETIEKKKPKFMESIFTQTNKEDDLMDKAVMEVLSQVAETQKQLLTSVEGLTENLSTLKGKDQGAAGGDTEGKNDQGAAGGNTEGKEELTAMQEKITELSSALKASQDSIAAMTESLSQFTDEQERHQADGGGAGEEELTPKNIL